MKKILKLFKKLIKNFALLVLIAGSFGLTSGVAHAGPVGPNWNVTGNYVINMQYNGTNNPHNMSLVQDTSGNITGSGGSPAGVNVYTWVITSGLVLGNSINIIAKYTATADAVTPQTILNLTGTVALDGTISGTWSDNYQGGTRTGTFTTTSGNAVPIITVKPVTNPATTITSTDATLNGVNGNTTATDSSFWVSTAPFVTTSSILPAGVFSTLDLGPINANTAFSASLSSVTGLPAITPNTQYYFTVWSEVGNVWHSGAVLTFTTNSTGINGTITGTVTGGSGVLHVDSITSEPTNANGTADGTYADGWSYVFHITAPINEPNLSMRFSDWLNGANILPVANNMRISSAQATVTTPITLTAANAYSTALVMTGDLDPNTAGRQVDILVEVSIPAVTINGSYNTSYGVSTN